VDVLPDYYLVKNGQTQKGRDVWRAKDPDTGRWVEKDGKPVYLYWFAEDRVWNLSSYLDNDKHTRLGYISQAGSSDCPGDGGRGVDFYHNEKTWNRKIGRMNHYKYPLIISGIRNYYLVRTDDKVSGRNVWRAEDPRTGDWAKEDGKPVYLYWFAEDRVWNLASSKEVNKNKRYGYVADSGTYPASGAGYWQWPDDSIINQLFGEANRTICEPAPTTTTTTTSTTTVTTTSTTTTTVTTSTTTTVTTTSTTTTTVTTSTTSTTTVTTTTTTTTPEPGPSTAVVVGAASAGVVGLLAVGGGAYAYTTSGAVDTDLEEFDLEAPTATNVVEERDVLSEMDLDNFA